MLAFLGDIQRQLLPGNPGAPKSQVLEAWSSMVLPSSSISSTVEHQGGNYSKQMCHGQKSRFIGDGKIPPLKGILIMGPINPYYWVDEFIPYMEMPWELIDPGTNT